MEKKHLKYLELNNQIKYFLKYWKQEIYLVIIWFQFRHQERNMTGRGKGGKGLGKGGAKRHRKVLRDNIQVRYLPLYD